MHRWLRLPGYRDLAEVPENGFALNSQDPRVFALLDELYSELLPNFSSRLFNVSCEEVFDLGCLGVEAFRA